MEAAEKFVNNWTFEEFTEDLKTQFAVIRALEIIGEAAKNIPSEVQYFTNWIRKSSIPITISNI